ncbi:hypothetical protein VNI00_010625 [Paramarasmius palmivorus]|uniref:FAD-binding PCMH-type domain-containing protein n=1 Tax=Paramarasmius palmivorus TaxID=297713 RepID=A0AAW0CL83_9AGAR
MNSRWSSLVIFVSLVAAAGRANGTPAAACEALQSALPGRVFFPGSNEYIADNEHYYGSSSETSTCSVEPESAADVGTILQVVGSGDTKSPFAIKCGGHANGLGFSSTTGVQISLSRLNEVNYDAASSTVKIGAGLAWDEVYNRLSPQGVTVAGGRVPGVGVGGLLLGGGYGYFTDEYGLSIDNVVAHDLVLPDGTSVEVTEASDPDLFFSLKGGFNNFGIVTAFTVKTHPQTDVWVATVVNPSNSTAAIQAIADFSVNNQDLKAQITPVYGYTGGGGPQFAVPIFYNGPSPSDVFNGILDVPGADNLFSGSMTLPQATEALYGSFVDTPLRGEKHTIPITHYTVPLIEEMFAQVDKIAADAEANGRALIAVSIVMEPFVDPYAHSTPSAYPHPPPPARFSCPTLLDIHWQNAADDAYFKNVLKEAQQAIMAKAIEEGQSVPGAILYSNYAPPDTPPEQLFGAENLARMRQVRDRVDPGRVMAQTGGFKI